MKIATIPKLIVVEGPHGSGKTSLAKALVHRLRSDHVKALYTKEPYSQLLKKNISILASQRLRDPIALAYLIAADRHLHVANLQKWAEEGITNVSDRYLDSSVVYQRIDGINLDLIERLNFFVPNPRFRIYINAPYRIRRSRLVQKLREQRSHIFLSEKALRKEQRLYDELIASRKGRPRCLVLDGSRPLALNAERALAFVRGP